MKAEKPALGISRSTTYSDAQVYHVECSCTDPDHAVDTWIEVSPDDDIEEIDVTFFVKTNFKRTEGFKDRVKSAWGILFGNGYEQFHNILLKKQTALNFSAALEQAIKDLENADRRTD